MARTDMVKSVYTPIEYYGEMFHSNITIPANTSTAGTAEIEAGGTMGAIAVAVVAEAAVAITAAKSVSLTVKAANKAGDTYTTVVDTEKVFTAPVGNAAFEAGELIGVVNVPPEVGPVWKVDIATDDTGATGKVNVIPYYLPR